MKRAFIAFVTIISLFSVGCASGGAAVRFAREECGLTGVVLIERHDVLNGLYGCWDHNLASPGWFTKHDTTAFVVAGNDASGIRREITVCCDCNQYTLVTTCRLPN